MSTIWAWNNGGISYLPYPKAVSDQIEAAFQEGRPNINLGTYWIDFMKLEQHRSDNPGRVRKVRREVVAPAPAAAPAAPTLAPTSASVSPPAVAAGASHGRSHAPRPAKSRTHRARDPHDRRSDDDDDSGGAHSDADEAPKHEPPRKRDDETGSSH